MAKKKELTPEERDAIQFEINGYEGTLNATDYKCLKHMDGALTDEEYADVKALRQECRDKINELQAKLGE